MSAKTQAQLQADIDSQITSCGNQCITGPILNNILNDHVESNLNILAGAGDDIVNNLVGGSSAGVPFVIRSPLIDFKTPGDTDIFTVPNGLKLMVNAVEFVAISNFTVASGTNLPEITMGFTTDRDAMVQAQQLVHFESGSRHIFDSFNMIDGGKTVSVSISTASTVNGTHQGYAIFNGYMVNV